LLAVKLRQIRFYHQQINISLPYYYMKIHTQNNMKNIKNFITETNGSAIHHKRMEKYVKVPEELLNKMTALCDICEFSTNESVAKLAKEVRAVIDKGLDYIE